MIQENIREDHLVKATAEGVRVYAAVTTGLVNAGIRRHGCYPVAAAALGRTMTGALLLAANLKNKECLTIKFQGDGPLGTVAADASPEGSVRGYVACPQINLPLNSEGKLAVGEGIGHGLVSVTRFTGLKEPVTGTSEIVTGEIAEDITQYLYVSEQTPSSVGLGVRRGMEMKAIAAGGFFIQPLPDASEEVLDRLEKNLASVRPVSAMIADGLDGRGIIHELLAGFSIHYLTETALAFRCQCSKKRIEGVLMSLGEKDLDSLVQDGKAEVGCQFCGAKYQFAADELIALRDTAQTMRRCKKE